MQNIKNTSGQGPQAQVPVEIAKEFNWGAFLLNWVWGIGNGTFITLVIIPAAILNFIPVVGLIVQIGLAVWFGKMGNTWAWQNKQFDSIEAFNEYQKKWVIAGLILFGVTIAIAILFTVLALLGAAVGMSAK